jgi:hypothetical protein
MSLIDTGFLVHKRFIPAVKKVAFVSDRMSQISLVIFFGTPMPQMRIKIKAQREIFKSN